MLHELWRAHLVGARGLAGRADRDADLGELCKRRDDYAWLPNGSSKVSLCRIVEACSRGSSHTRRAGTQQPRAARLFINPCWWAAMEWNAKRSSRMPGGVYCYRAAGLAGGALLGVPAGLTRDRSQAVLCVRACHRKSYSPKSTRRNAKKGVKGIEDRVWWQAEEPLLLRTHSSTRSRGRRTAGPAATGTGRSCSAPPPHM